MPQRNRRLNQRFPSGFTLVEVLVALLVLALAMSALQLRLAQQLDSAGYLRERSLAQWVAVDQLERAQLASRLGATLPDNGTGGEVRFAGQRWRWRITPQALPPGLEDAAFLPVSVGVSPVENTTDLPLLTIDGVLETGHAY